MDDSRVNIETVLTSTIDEYTPGMKGANVLTYVKFESFVKNEKGVIIGANLYDKMNKKSFYVNCKAVVNATGTGSDVIRRLDDELVAKRTVFARGTHVTLSSEFCDRDHGLFIPDTTDGRVLFVLPWLSGTVVGTTDENVPENSIHPIPTDNGKHRLFF